MAHYSILITSSPFDEATGLAAIDFARALLAQGHEIDQVFFYQAGVYHANEFTHVPGENTNQFEAWVNLHQDTNVPLWVCVTAAAKRGVISAAEASEQGKSGFNLRAPFEQVGIGEFFATLHNSEHLVQF